MIHFHRVQANRLRPLEAPMMFRRHRLRHIARKLTTAQLQREDSSGLALEEFSLFEVGNRGGDRFLGFYSAAGLRLAMEKYGLFKLLAQRGYPEVYLHLDTSDPFVHRLRLDCEHAGTNEVLAELVVRRENMMLAVPTSHPLAKHPFPMLTIEWLYLQDVRRRFDSCQPQLPGQDHPGLGLARIVLELLLVVCWRLNLAGLLNHPAAFHNAVMGQAVFSFTEPESQARFEALKRDLAGYTLQAASWALAWGCVIDRHRNHAYTWHSDRYMVALDAQLKNYLNSIDYLHRRWETTGTYFFELDVVALKARAARSDIFIPRIFR